MPSQLRALASIAAALSLFGCSSGSSPPVPAAAPSSVQATACGRRAIVLRWTQPAVYQHAVVVERSSDSGSFQPIHTAAANETAYVDYRLVEDIEYSYRLVNTNRSGASDYSSVVSATATAPDLVVLSRTNAAGQSQLVLAHADDPGSALPLAPSSSLEIRSVDDQLHDQEKWILYTAGPVGQPALSQLLAVPTCGDQAPRELTPLGEQLKFEVYDDRYVLTLLDTGATQQFTSTDLRGATTTITEGAIQWDPRARHQDGSIYYTDGDVWTVQPDAATPPRLLGSAPAPGQTHSPLAQTLVTGHDRRPLVVDEAIAVHDPRTNIGSDWDLSLYRYGGQNSLMLEAPWAPAHMQLDSFGVAANRLVWRAVPYFGTAYSALYSATATGPARSLTPRTSASVSWEGLRHEDQLIFTMESPGAPSVPSGLFSVPVDGSTPPIFLAMGPMADLRVIANTGSAIVYTRAYRSGTVYTSRVGHAISEVPVPIPGSADIFATVFAAEGGPERPALAVVLRAATSNGGQAHWDLWSITETSGVIDTVRLSRQQIAQQAPSILLAFRDIGNIAKEGRILYVRGRELHSAALGVQDSERRLTNLGAGISQLKVDPTARDGTVYFVARRQVWSAPIDGSRPAVQLSALAATVTEVRIEAIGPKGTVAFTATDAGVRAAWIAQTGIAASATPVPGQTTVHAVF